MNILRVLIALASGLSLSQTIFAATIPVNEDVMTSVFFQVPTLCVATQPKATAQ